MVTCTPASHFCCWSTSIQTTPWSQVWQQTASPHCSSPMVSPSWGLSSPWSTTKTAWQQQPPAGLCHRGRAVTSLPPALAPPATLAKAAGHGRWSSATLSCLAWAFQLKSLQTDGSSGRQCLSPVTHLKVCTPMTSMSLKATDNGDNYAEV